MKYNRLLPLLIPLIVLMFFEVFFFYPKMIYAVLILVNLFIFFTVWRFSRASDVDKSWWNFFILPCLMSASIIAYTVLLANKTIIQSLFILNVILLYFYLRYVYYYLLRPAAYKPFSIENISSYGNFLTFFLISAACYGLQSFLNLRVWLLMAVVLLAAALIIYQIIWANKIDFKKSLPYILINCLILAELSWSLSFLPLNHNVSGLTLAICYYMLMGLSRHHLLGGLDKSKIKLYLSFGFISILIILLTARWL
ncbi:hypothetical protein KJ586_00515 [Patescibacteria group bacterium]|nr:hypothetical protein [Patescibacteria group bacterium]